MTVTNKSKDGFVYNCKDGKMREIKLNAVEMCRELDAINMHDKEAKEKVIRKLFGSAGENPSVFPGFHCDNGFNIFVGNNFFANYNVTILDRAPVTIGDDCLLAPGVLISTAAHPLSPKERREGLSTADPITLGNDVWVGGNAVILPGVTIGNNVVVAAGAVVTQDVPDNCIVGGVPARLIKYIEA